MFPHPRCRHVQTHVPSAIAKAVAAAVVLVVVVVVARFGAADFSAGGSGSGAGATPPPCGPVAAAAPRGPSNGAGCPGAESRPAVDVAERIVDWGGQSEEGWSGITAQSGKPVATRPADDRRRVFEERRRRYEGEPAAPAKGK